MGQRNISKGHQQYLLLSILFKTNSKTVGTRACRGLHKPPPSPTPPASATTTHYDFTLLQRMQTLIRLQAFVCSVPLTWVLFPHTSSDWPLPRSPVSVQIAAPQIQTDSPSWLPGSSSLLLLPLALNSPSFYSLFYSFVKLTSKIMTRIYSFTYLFPPLRTKTSQKHWTCLPGSLVQAFHLTHSLNEWRK